MGHTFSLNLFHIIFSTKDRCRLLDDRCRNELHRYLNGTAKSLDCVLLEINSVPDHLHCLARIAPAVPVSELIGKLKSNSSRWLKERFELPCGFHWQPGYASFSVSQSAVEQVRTYIQNQQTHHTTITFEQELKLFLDRHNINYDPNNLFG